MGDHDDRHLMVRPGARADARLLAHTAEAAFRRKIEVQTDWASALFFRREVVSLGSLQRPRQEFAEFAPLPKVQEQPAAAVSGPGVGGKGQ